MHCIPVSCNSCCLVPSCALWSTFSCFYMLCSLPSGAMLLTTTCLPAGTLLLTVNYLMMLFHALFVAVSLTGLLMQQLLLSTILCSLVYLFLFLYALFIAFWCYTVNYYLLTCRYSAVKLDDVVSCLLSGALWFTFLLLYNILLTFWCSLVNLLLFRAMCCCFMHCCLLFSALSFTFLFSYALMLLTIWCSVVCLLVFPSIKLLLYSCFVLCSVVAYLPVHYAVLTNSTI
jgi:hypothetical protein